MKTSFLRLGLVAAQCASLLLVSPLPVRAGECFVGTVQKLSGTVTIKSGVFLRDNACMEQSSVIVTVPGGTKVTVLGEWDGWYKIEYAGQRGWLYNTFVSNLAVSDAGSTEYKQFEAAYPSGKTGSSATPTPTAESTPVISGDLTTRMKGYILLQVENHGEAWYVNPTVGKRYYMKDGPTAYEMMRAFGLGVSESDYSKLENDDLTLRRKLAGRIVLRAQAKGEAYYIHPKTLSVNYLKDGAEAYRIMRLLSLGITNNNLNQIPSAEFTALPNKTTSTQTESTTTVSTAPKSLTTTSITLSSEQEGWVPSNLNLVELNKYWLAKINAVRAKKGLRQLVLDQRLINTATEWSNVMGKQDELTHDRANGQTMHQWIDTKDITFTERNSTDGWTSNYFTENIARDYVANDMTDAKQALSRTMDAFLSEGESGDHYRTIYHADWNAVGVGFYFTKLSYSNAKVYMTFHYGSVMK